MSVKSVLVVGGGIGGLTAAIALRRKGIAVDLVEINTSFKVYHVGIIIQANTIRAMKEIGLADKIVAAGYPYRGVEICDAQGVCQSHVEGARIAGEDYPSDLGMGRPALHKVLTDAVAMSGAKVKLGVTVDQVEEHGGKVHVTLTDGTSASYDLVIGADGINSKMRQRLFGEEFSPKFTGQGVWRYNVPRPKDIDVAALYIGKETKAGFVPLTKETMYILLVTAEPGNPMLPPDQLAPLMRERMAEFGGIVGEARDAFINDSEMVVYRPLESVMVTRPWFIGQITLLGDSAHATSPHLGQGAAQAIEDAIVLAEEAATGKPVNEVLEAYMARRYERCKFINESSNLIGEWELTHNPDADHAGIRRKMLEVVAAPL